MTGNPSSSSECCKWSRLTDPEGADSIVFGIRAMEMVSGNLAAES